MNFKALQRRVQRRERMVEGRAQLLGERWNALKSGWREGWTPWRIVSAGLVAGFLTGHAEPLRALTGPRLMQMIGAVSSLFASVQAAAAGEAAEEATERVAGAPLPEEPLVDEAFDAEAPVVAPRPAEAATELSER